MPSSNSPRQTPARASKRRLPLAIDTSFSRHRAVPMVNVEAEDARTQYYVEKSKAPTTDVPTFQRPRLHSRIAQLRPTELNLDHGVSPSDRAIPIGIALASPSVPIFTGDYTESPENIEQQDSLRSQKLPTPTIVITPAQEEFPAHHPEAPRRRPSSSVYSRYTECGPKDETSDAAPPVPHLPSLFQMEDTTTQPTTSIVTTSPMPRTLNTPCLPTPRRSNGWWNIIMSPFTAKSATFSHHEDEDTRPIVGGNAESIFTERGESDDELRSAPATIESAGTPRIINPALKRADTAPSILTANTPKVNIYRTPSRGEAAAYYDLNRRFPSFHGPVARHFEDVPEGWSPSQSVAGHSSPHFLDEHSRSAQAPDHIDDIVIMPRDFLGDATEQSVRAMPVVTSSPALRAPAQAATLSTPAFSTPSEAELSDRDATQQDHTPIEMPMPASHFSPMTATPFPEDSNRSTYGGSVPMPELPPMPIRGMSEDDLSRPAVQEATPHNESPKLSKLQRPLHLRQDSHGLGISNSENETFPPMYQMSEKGHAEDIERGGASEADDAGNGLHPTVRRLLPIFGIIVAIMAIVGIVLLALYIPHENHGMNVEAAWVNTTGFPPVQTGVTTVISPQNNDIDNTCVASNSLWSCSAAQNQQPSILPDFRMEIWFQNGTLPANETAALRRRHGSNTPSPLPAPPSLDDQEFIGWSTDNVSMPYSGEETPFYISLLNATTLPTPESSILHRRSSNWTYPYPTPSNDTTTSSPDKIPAPSLSSHGLPLPDLLYPLLTTQPLKLYNRGQGTEHLGFYTYFDRTILVPNLSPPTSTNTTNTTSTTNSTSTAYCTWSQTRLHVQIWTQRGTLSTPTNTTATISSLPSSSAIPAANSTANIMTAPGSFAYPVTITLDRHGGDAGKKGVFCYAVDAETGKVDVQAGGWWVEEDRGTGRVNPAAVPEGEDARRSRRDASGGSVGKGIDGGSGGCKCQWESG